MSISKLRHNSCIAAVLVLFAVFGLLVLPAAAAVNTTVSVNAVPTDNTDNNAKVALTTDNTTVKATASTTVAISDKLKFNIKVETNDLVGDAVKLAKDLKQKKEDTSKFIKDLRQRIA